MESLLHWLLKSDWSKVQWSTSPRPIEQIVRKCILQLVPRNKNIVDRTMLSWGWTTTDSKHNWGCWWWRIKYLERRAIQDAHYKSECTAVTGAVEEDCKLANLEWFSEEEGTTWFLYLYVFLSSNLSVRQIILVASVSVCRSPHWHCQRKLPENALSPCWKCWCCSQARQTLTVWTDSSVSSSYFSLLPNIWIPMCLIVP